MSSESGNVVTGGLNPAKVINQGTLEQHQCSSRAVTLGRALLLCHLHSPCHGSWGSLPLPSTAPQNPDSATFGPPYIPQAFTWEHQVHTSPAGSPPFSSGMMDRLDHRKAGLTMVLFSLYLHTRLIQHFCFIRFSI